MIEPSARISRCRIPTALVEASSDRKEFEQTSSARWGVQCAAVVRIGRISCRTTGTPDFAACHAASEPARPPPMMWIGRIAAFHKTTRRRQSIFAELSERGRGREGRPWADAPVAGASRLFRISRSGRNLARNGTAHDEFDIAAANADIVQLAIGELRKFTHRLAISAPSCELLRNRLERGHRNSVSGRHWPTALQHNRLLTLAVGAA